MTCIVEPLVIAGVAIQCWCGAAWIDVEKITCSTRYEQTSEISPSSAHPVKIAGEIRWLCIKGKQNEQNE